MVFSRLRPVCCFGVPMVFVAIAFWGETAPVSEFVRVFGKGGAFRSFGVSPCCGASVSRCFLGANGFLPVKAGLLFWGADGVCRNCVLG